MSRFWCGVVSREHILRGVQGGFCQVCHGKRGSLARMAAGDGIVFYSPVLQFQGAEKCQRFTAIGRVVGDDTYQVEMTPDFHPFRRDVAYQACDEAPIHPLLQELEFTRGRSSWGYSFRMGHFEVSEADFMLIAKAMLPGAQGFAAAAESARPRQGSLLFEPG
ncbi:EVE domain-containing protein [Rugamonas sp. CCM 8940]|uniref:EVE domain-containing protein n=1 Tax=Rugamonas sp. CCM 8940 TaxID=2765359 RepID=UPI0018F52FEA|nr:EVE domain-containing protein [Rugamonas sp. CCM 8940]MBJ7310373.1 EVE domain-containing protein [Rugamonas sp. CCM 8940]